MVKKCRSEDPYEDGTLTPIITSFSKERSSFFKIHGTSPSLEYHELEGPAPTYDHVLSNRLVLGPYITSIVPYCC